MVRFSVARSRKWKRAKISKFWIQKGAVFTDPKMAQVCKKWLLTKIGAKRNKKSQFSHFWLLKSQPGNTGQINIFIILPTSKSAGRCSCQEGCSCTQHTGRKTWTFWDLAQVGWATSVFQGQYLAPVASGADATSELLGLPPDDLGEVADHAVVGGAVERTQVGGVQVPLLQ